MLFSSLISLAPHSNNFPYRYSFQQHIIHMLRDKLKQMKYFLKLLTSNLDKTRRQKVVITSLKMFSIIKRSQISS